MMKKLFTAILLLIVAGAVAAAVAAVVARKRLESMSDDEIRAFLASKLEGRVPEEQLATIQEATVSGIRKKMRGPDADESGDPSAASESADDGAGDDEATDTTDEADDAVTIAT